MPKLEVRLSAEEKGLLRRNADRAGQSVSTYVRQRLFPDVSPERAAEVKVILPSFKK